MQINASLFTSSFCWLPLMCYLTASIIPVHKSSIITQHFHNLHRLLLLFKVHSKNMCTDIMTRHSTLHLSFGWLQQCG